MIVRSLPRSLAIAVLLGVSGWSTIGSPDSRDDVAVEKAVAPSYPELLAAAGVEGTISVRVVLSPSGDVISAEGDGRNTALRESAERSARLWHFSACTSGASRSANLVFVFKRLPPNAPKEDRLPVFYPPFRIQVASDGSGVSQTPSEDPHLP